MRASTEGEGRQGKSGGNAPSRLLDVKTSKRLSRTIIELTVCAEWQLGLILLRLLPPSPPPLPGLHERWKETHIVSSRNVLRLSHDARHGRMKAVIICWCEAEDGNSAVLEGRGEGGVLKEGWEGEVLPLRMVRMVSGSKRRRK
jgi:hypothetical protein